MLLCLLMILSSSKRIVPKIGGGDLGAVPVGDTVVAERGDAVVALGFNFTAAGIEEFGVEDLDGARVFGKHGSGVADQVAGENDRAAKTDNSIVPVFFADV